MILYQNILANMIISVQNVRTQKSLINGILKQDIYNFDKTGF
jgi:hypothetical protein